MNRFERVLVILLLLRSGKTISAVDLAQRFEVSIRTIYRDVDTLSGLGVPVYAEMGRQGGFRLMEGYFLPPIMFSTQEATTLLMGLLLVRRLRVAPFTAELETAEHKLLTAMPDHLRTTVTRLKDVIGFEAVPTDIFSAEEPDAAAPVSEIDESAVVSLFLRSILEYKWVHFQYHSPYSRQTKDYESMPQGVLWDRDRWYLVGRYQQDETRLWRADRVLKIRQGTVNKNDESDEFQISNLLGRSWLRDAMQQWIQESPVIIRLSREQADRLEQDWYFGYARYENTADGQVLMTYGEDNQHFVFNLMRWLGTGAELVEPRAWRAALRDELLAMADKYAD